MMALAKDGGALVHVVVKGSEGHDGVSVSTSVVVVVVV